MNLYKPSVVLPIRYDNLNQGAIPIMQKKNLIILGTGFAALSLLRKIDPKKFNITLVSPRNHFLFTPLLPSTTVGTIEFRSIIEPIRTQRKPITFYQARCISIDANRRLIECVSVVDNRSFSLEFDFLAITVGAVSNTFGIPGVERHALFLKELGDARRIRRHIIQNFEQASIPGLPEDERRRLLHFVVVGGGPTGVEFAAEMHDFLTDDLKDSYKPLVADVRITLLEATNKILSTFDKKLSTYALQLFQRQRINVRIDSIVTGVLEREIRLRDGTAIPYGLLVWSTGNTQTPFVSELPFAKDPTGRLATDSYFRITGTTNIFAAGDCATVEGKNFPATAQVAMQAGKYIGTHLNAIVDGRNPNPFTYKHFGMLAYVGSNRALADLPKLKGKGFSTWLFWRSAYLTRLVSTKNKILVLFDWVKTFLFGRDVSSF
jgi:NADH:ubiquinone reductase (non-electrogenic)